MSVCYRPPGNETLLSWKASRATGTTFLLLAALLGLPGNGFVVWSLAGWRPTAGRPLAATLVLHLALADGAVLLLTPLFVAFLSGQAWPLGQVGCKAVYYVCALSMYASVLLTGLLSLQRCLAVTRPFLTPRLRSPALARRLLLGVWLVALVLAVPAAVYRHLWGNGVCQLCHPSAVHAAAHLSLETLTAFVVPFGTVLCCYGVTVARLRGARWGSRRHGTRVGRLVSAIVLAFGLLWAPYHAVNLLQAVAALAPPEGPLARLGGAGQAARAGTTALAFFSSSVNPVLYVFTAGDLLPRAGPRFLTRLFEGSWETRAGSRSREGTMELRTTPKLKVVVQGRGNGDPGGGVGTCNDLNVLLQEGGLKHLEHQENPVLLGEMIFLAFLMASNTTSPASSSPRGMPLALPIVLLSVALAVGLPGNSFVVWSILKRMKKRSVTALLVLNLAVADLAVLLTAPFFLHALAQRGSWTFGVSGCRLCNFICGVSMYASVLLITIMSLDRSLAVARPFVSQKVRTKKIARLVLVIIWVVSFLLATPVLVYRTVKPYKKILVCSSDYPSDGHSAFHLLFETITGFLLPFLVVVVSYSDIGRRLQARRFRRSRRTGRLVALIILAFAAFWLPYHLVNLVEAGRVLAGWDKSDPVGQHLNTARKVLIALAFLSSSVNPVLYACAGGGLLRSAGAGFVVKMLEATGSEVYSTRRGGTLGQTQKATPACPEPDPTTSSTPT
ncbi:leukotriene B4 receptor 2 [Sigmodon hispidus]